MANTKKKVYKSKSRINKMKSRINKIKSKRINKIKSKRINKRKSKRIKLKIKNLGKNMRTYRRIQYGCNSKNIKGGGLSFSRPITDVIYRNDSGRQSLLATFNGYEPSREYTEAP